MCREISNGGEAALALKMLIEWVKEAKPEELEKVVAFVDECETKAEGGGEALMYENLWGFLTSQIAKKEGRL